MLEPKLMEGQQSHTWPSATGHLWWRCHGGGGDQESRLHRSGQAGACDHQECGVSGIAWPQAKAISDKTVPASLGLEKAGAVARA